MRVNISPYQSSKTSQRFSKETHLDGELQGWILHEHLRIDSKHIDRYWFTPKTRKKLRSRVEVNRFNDYLLRHGSDKEEEAWKSISRGKTKRSGSDTLSTAATKKQRPSRSSDTSTKPKKKISSTSRSRKVSNCEVEPSFPSTSFSSELELTQTKEKPRNIQESTNQRKEKMIILAAFEEYKKKEKVRGPMSAFDMETLPKKERPVPFFVSDTIAQPKVGGVGGDDAGGASISKNCKDIKSVNSQDTIQRSRSREKESKISESKSNSENIFYRSEGRVTERSGVSHVVPEIAESKDSSDSEVDV